MNWFNLVTSGATRRDVVGEKENLAEKEPQKLKELSAAWNKWNSQMVDPALRPRQALPSTEQASATTVQIEMERLAAI